MNKKSVRCAVCTKSNIRKFLSLGPSPLANSLLTEDELNKGEMFFPLDVYFCTDCSHVGIFDIVPPEILFRNYFYMTSMSKTMFENLTNLVNDIRSAHISDNSKLIIDVGSNDGTLLGIFKSNGFGNVLGIEPATNIAKIAHERGIRTENEFFNIPTSHKVLTNYGKASVITATNVFAHVADLDGFVQGVVNLLEDDGTFVFENAYLLDLVNKTEFDTIYHEHLYYYAIKPLTVLFDRFGMEVVDVKRLPIHGGSIRVFVKKKGRGNVSQNVHDMIEVERNAGLYDLDTYIKFADRVKQIRRDLVALLEKLKSEGKRIVGYGATAKGTTLANYCRIDTELLDYIVDMTPLKQNKYYPGVHIPIKSPEHFHNDNPDYVLLLAWNFAEEIMSKEKDFIQKGGKFIVPVPTPQIVDRN